MKIEIDCALLKAELQKVKDIVSSRNTMPLLSNALISADDDDSLTITATDLDISISTSCKCKVSSPGSATLQALTLLDAVSRLRDEQSTIELGDNYRARLSAGSSSCEIPGTAASDYPSIPSSEQLDFYTVDAKAFLNMIQKTSFSISTEDSRPNLTGAFLKLTDNSTLLMVTTDGHRLSKIEMPVDSIPTDNPPPALKQGVIIPAKGIKQLSKHIDHEAFPLEIAFDSHNVFFKHGPMILTMREVEGQYPDFSQIVPTTKGDAATVPLSQIYHAVQFVRIFSNSKTNRVRFTFTEDNLNIYANDADTGEGVKDIEAIYKGKTIELGFNVRFLLDIFSAINSESITFYITDVLAPTIIQDPDEDDLVYVVMPMRL